MSSCSQWGKVYSRPFAALSRQTQTFCFDDVGKAKDATLRGNSYLMLFREAMKLSFGQVGRMKYLRPSACVCGK